MWVVIADLNKSTYQQMLEWHDMFNVKAAGVPADPLSGKLKQMFCTSVWPGGGGSVFLGSRMLISCPTEIEKVGWDDSALFQLKAHVDI